MRLYKNIPFFFAIFLLFTACVAAQTKSASFAVIDFETKQSIAFAPVLNLTQKNLTYSNESGIVDIPYGSISDSIEICFISFQCMKTSISYIQKLENKTIYLKQNPIILQTVNVYPTKKSQTEIGYHKSKTDFKWGSGSGLIFANYFKNIYTNTPYVSRVFVDLNSSIKEKANTLIRVRLFYPNLDGSPGKDLINDNLYYVVKRVQSKFEVNIDSLNITIPQNGIVVGLEIIGYYKRGKLETSKKGTYTIGICSTKDPNRSQIGSAWRYSTFEKKWFSANFGLGKDTMFKIGLELSD